MRPLGHRLLAILVQALLVQGLGGAVLGQLFPLELQALDAAAEVVDGAEVPRHVLDGGRDGGLEEELLVVRILGL